MNWAQFKDLASHMCLAGAVVASWSLIQGVASLSPFTIRKRSCGKVMFSRECIKNILSTERECTPLGRHPHGQTQPQTDNPHPRAHTPYTETPCKQTPLRQTPSADIPQADTP